MTRREGLLAKGVVAAVALAAGAANCGIEIRCDHPGGNVRVGGVDETNGVVRVAPDLRSTRGKWFHFDFKARHHACETTGLYASTRAFKELLVRESNGKRIVFFDLHAPGPRDDNAYTLCDWLPEKNARWRAFRRNFKAAQKGGALAYGHEERQHQLPEEPLFHDLAGTNDVARMGGGASELLDVGLRRVRIFAQRRSVFAFCGARARRQPAQGRRAHR